MRALFLSPLIILACSAVARGDIVMMIDLDTSTPGIQSSIDVTAGQTITAGLNLQITSSSVTGLGGYSMTVLFDSDKLNLGPNTLAIPNPNPPFGEVFVNRRQSPPSGWSTFGDQSDNVEGSLTNTNPELQVFYANTGAFFNVSAGAPSGGIGPGTNLQIFEFTIEATQTGTISSDFAGDPSVVVSLFKASDGFLDATEQLIPLSQLQNVNGPVAIPEPSSLAFLGLGALLVVRRRRNKRNTPGPGQA